MTAELLIALGSQNAAKISSVELALQSIFPLFSVVGFNVPSGVSDQPMSDDESMHGAINRAKAALIAMPTANYAIGIEGGVNKVLDKWFECGWVCVLDSTGANMGLGSSGRFELSNKIMQKIHNGMELSQIMDELTGLHDVRSSAGAMGILTNGILNRADAYHCGIIFAFAPFISEEKYWK